MMANQLVSNRESSERNQVVITIDFSSMPNVTLFTGRKNGKAAKPYFNVKQGTFYIFKANDDQVITSSYFLGLVGDELSNLLGDLENISELLKHISTENISAISQNECVRAIKRGLAPDVATL